MYKTGKIMKLISLIISMAFAAISWAQRPATQAEQLEDARVLKILSQAMPHEMEDWQDEGERSFGESNLQGISGFHNNMNFATRDIFTHQYNISWRLLKAPASLQKKIDIAKTPTDFAYIMSASTCEIDILVNYEDGNIHANTPFKKLLSPYGQHVYRDEANSEYTLLFLGKNWTLSPYASVSDDGRGNSEKQYYIKQGLKNAIGTVVQSIMIVIRSNAAVADGFMKQIDWAKINGLLGTGAIQDNMEESGLKKYYVEKPTTPIAGKNTLSFTMIAEDGTIKNMVMSSAKHDRPNCARLRNHNENPKIMEEAHIDFYITDDKNTNQLFMMSLPIIRTTGTVEATYASDYDYQIMWRGNTDVNHSLSPINIEIHLTKWAAVGDFMEGSFSGTATLSDHNDFSTEKPVYTIKNGKFRIRRIADEMH